MATKRQKLFLTFYISRASLFGLGYSRMFFLSNNDTWISAIIGMLLGIIIIFMISKILNDKKDKSLNDYLKKNNIIRLFIILLCSFFIVILLTSLISFMTSFFLLNTPGYLIGLFTIITLLYVLKKEFNAILRTSEILFYFSIFLIIITLLGLIKYINILHVFPMLITKTKPLFKASLIFCLYTTIPFLTLLNINDDGKGLIKMYLFNCITIILLIFFILVVFGPEFTKILRFPEYIVLKRIKILSFIEKIESILSISYILDNLLLMLLSIYTIKKLINFSGKNSFYFYGIIASIYLFTIKFMINNYINALNNYYIIPYILLLGLLIIFYLYIRTLKKKPKLQIHRDT